MRQPIQLLLRDTDRFWLLFTSDDPASANHSFPGGHTAGVTPVPIPNTEVKPRRADGTARATVWERRSLPAIK